MRRQQGSAKERRVRKAAAMSKSICSHLRNAFIDGTNNIFHISPYFRDSNVLEPVTFADLPEDAVQSDSDSESDSEQGATLLLCM